MKTSLGVLHLMLVEQPAFPFPRSGSFVKSVKVEFERGDRPNEIFMVEWFGSASAAAFVEDVCPGHVADHRKEE